jgi:hypothetical protein
MKTSAPYHYPIAVQSVAWLAIAVISPIALPSAARGGQEAGERAADAIVLGRT